MTLPPLTLTNASVLRPDGFSSAPLSLSGDVIGAAQGRVVDLSGYLILPGIIDLHGDGFERHLSPRPSAPFDKRRALASAAAVAPSFIFTKNGLVSVLVIRQALVSAKAALAITVKASAEVVIRVFMFSSHEVFLGSGQGSPPGPCLQRSD